MFFPSRSRRRGPDPHLDLKIALFSVGAVLALVGMLTENRWVLGAATLVLLGGFFLQFRRGEGEPDDEDADAGEDGTGPD